MTAEQPVERVREYRFALGEFVDAFAAVEGVMFRVLRWYSQTTFATARAVFSGTRIGVAASFLKRLAEAGVIGAEDCADLEPLLERLSAITTARDRVLHYGAMGIAEGVGVVTDALKAVTEDRIRTFPISAALLADMTHDTRKIFIHLAVGHVGYPELRAKNPGAEHLLRATWRYTPPQPHTHRRPPASTTPKRQRQPAPSPESNGPENGQKGGES